MFCTNCGAPIEEGTRFCVICGQPVESAGNVTENVADSGISEDAGSAGIQPQPEMTESEYASSEAESENINSESQPEYDNEPKTGEESEMPQMDQANLVGTEITQNEQSTSENVEISQIDQVTPVETEIPQMKQVDLDKNEVPQNVQTDMQQAQPQLQRQVTKYMKDAVITPAEAQSEIPNVPIPPVPAVAEKKKNKISVLLIVGIAVAALVVLLLIALIVITASSTLNEKVQGVVASISGSSDEDSEDTDSEENLTDENNEDIQDPEETQPAEEEEQESETEDESEGETEDGDSQSSEETEEVEMDEVSRPLLISGRVDESQISSITPSVSEYTVEDNLSNVINKDDFSYYGSDFFDHLKEDQFLVWDDGGEEFFQIYESNAYSQTPNFVTVDAMMHTYHLYFAYLLKNIEKEYLFDELKSVSVSMLNEVTSQYQQLKGTEWESAARRNVAFFAVGTCLLDPTTEFHGDVNDIVNEEYSLIYDASGITESPIMGYDEDYSQYKPRGYYDGDEMLEKYFRAMMWYGRIQFRQNKEDEDRSALLITKALNDVGTDKWEAIYSVTSFFAGASDDLTYYEYMPALSEVYGEASSLSEVTADEQMWSEFHGLTSDMRAPRINSIPINEGEDNEILGYRFMGQRFSVDATIMQNLIYSRTSDDNDKRMLPDVLDVPAALGSDKAYEILDAAGVTDYKNYDENLEALKKEFNNNNSTIWNASLYAGWLNTIRPVLEKKGEGYPGFMQSDNWAKKDLETFAGSYTELKHDTVLYSKQVFAEMGGGDEEEKDDRGYVEPEPLVYLRFSELAKRTAEGLNKYGYLKSEDEENLGKLAELASKLQTISIKELQNELPSDEDFDLIRNFGGEIEHFWIDAISAMYNIDSPSTYEYPAALVTDIATDPNGSVLEIATGNPASIYVIAPVDGTLRICRGSVYSFYEFEQPINDRLTDKQWWKMLGIMIDDYEDPDKDRKDVEHPGWVESYRYKYSYEN